MALSSGAPMRRVLIRSCILAISGSAMLSCISRREPAQHTCPWLNQIPSTSPSTALSRSASSNTMNGDLPPSSSESFLWLVAVAARIARPTSVDPVNAILSTSGCLTSASPVDPSPVTMFTTPGRQARLLADFGKGERRERRELRRLQHNGVSRRQRRSNLPRQHQQRKIPRNNLPDNSARHILGKFLFQKLRPAGVMIEMPRDQRNVDVAALANRLAIVHRLQHREQPRMLLHQPRQRIQIARPRMRSERLPRWRRRPRRFHRCVDVRRGSLRHRRQPLPIRRIDGLEVLARRRRLPHAVDEMRKAPPMMIQPGEASFESSGAGPYSMLTNFSAMLIISQ